MRGGPGGMVVFDRLLAESRPRLSAGRYLILEIGSPQEKPARQQLEAIQEFTLFPTVIDFSGHPRVLRARRIEARPAPSLQPDSFRTIPEKKLRCRNDCSWLPTSKETP